jgi:hypothetical protein
MIPPKASKKDSVSYYKGDWAMARPSIVKNVQVKVKKKKKKSKATLLTDRGGL